jgi:hypothetical protein
MGLGSSSDTREAAPYLGLLALNEAKKVLKRSGDDAAKVGNNVAVLVLGADHGVRLAATRLTTAVKSSSSGVRNKMSGRAGAPVLEPSLRMHCLRLLKKSRADVLSKDGAVVALEAVFDDALADSREDVGLGGESHRERKAGEFQKRMVWVESRVCDGVVVVVCV